MSENDVNPVILCFAFSVITMCVILCNFLSS